MIAYVWSFFVACSLMVYYHIPSSSARYELDSVCYQRIAENIIDHYSPRDPEKCDAMPAHTLGYPFFLALIYALCRSTQFYWIFIIQLVCMACVFWSLHALSLHLFGKNAANCTLLLSAFNLGFMVYTNMLMPEIILITTLSLFLYFLIQSIESFWYAGGAGCMLALSLLIRPAALYFIPIIILFLLLMRARAACFLFLSTLLVPMTAYITMNYYLYEQPIISPLAAENMYYYYTPRLYAYLHDMSLTQAQEKLTSLDEATLKSIAHQSIIEHPVAAIFIWLQNVIRTVIGLYGTQLKVLLNPAIKGGACSFFRQQGTIITSMWRYIHFGTSSAFVISILLFEVMLLLFSYGATCIGLFHLWYSRRMLALFFISYISYFMLITGHDGCGRYRIMLEPVLLVCAGVGVMRLYHACKSCLCRYSRRWQRNPFVATES